MSDGPHRSLQQPRSWRKLAARVENTAYPTAQAMEAQEAALRQDFFELPDWLRYPSLLSTPAAGASVEPLTILGVILAETKMRVENGRHPSFASHKECVAIALRERALRQARSMEEHWLRNMALPEARRLAVRLREIRLRFDYRALAGRLIGKSRRKHASALPKRSELDEGLPL